MDLRQLEIVQAIADTGSFTAAGRKLHLSQSAVSRQVSLLEDELHQALFMRTARRIQITAAGEAIVRLSRRVFADIKDTETVMLESQRVLTGTIRLAAGMTICLYVFPSLLKEYRRRHPRVEIKLVTDATPPLIQALRAGAADLGLLTLPVDEPDLVTTPVMREELLLVTHPSHPLSRKKRIGPRDLAGQRFVLFESGSNSRRVIDSFFAKEQIEAQVVMETQNVEILKALARVGVGITVIPYQAVAREVRGGHLFCSRIVGVQLIRQTGWVHLRANRIPRTIEEMFLAFQQIMPRLRLAPAGPSHL